MNAGKYCRDTTRKSYKAFAPVKVFALVKVTVEGKVFAPVKVTVENLLGHFINNFN